VRILPWQHKAQAQYQRHQRLVHTLNHTSRQSHSEVPQLLVPVSVTALPYSRLLEPYSTCGQTAMTPMVPPAVRGHLYSSVQSYSQPALHRILLPRGDMENRIKEQQLDLFSDRTSTHELTAINCACGSRPYVLPTALRQHCLQTELATAQVEPSALSCSTRAQTA